MVTKVSSGRAFELSRDLSGNLVGNLTPKAAEFSVWTAMVKEALTRHAARG
jgi:hypothetical protein